MSGRVARKNEVERWVANRVLMHRRPFANRVVDRRLVERVITDPAAAKAPPVHPGGLAGTVEGQNERLCRAEDGWSGKGWMDRRCLLCCKMMCGRELRSQAMRQRSEPRHERCVSFQPKECTVGLSGRVITRREVASAIASACH